MKQKKSLTLLTLLACAYTSIIIAGEPQETSTTKRFFNKIAAGFRTGAQAVYHHAPARLYDCCWGTSPDITNIIIPDPTQYGKKYPAYFLKVYDHACDVKAVRDNTAKRSRTSALCAAATASGLVYYWLGRFTSDKKTAMIAACGLMSGFVTWGLGRLLFNRQKRLLLHEREKKLTQAPEGALLESLNLYKKVKINELSEIVILHKLFNDADGATLEKMFNEWCKQREQPRK